MKRESNEKAMEITVRRKKQRRSPYMVGKYNGKRNKREINRF